MEKNQKKIKDTKFVFVTGGVVSGLGKGITAASLGRLLKNRGYKVTNQKLDPYINVDPGTMSPYEHGEVFVTEDGAETDLDLGHYERFIDENLTGNSSITSGKIYSEVIERERRGDYLGKTVQVIPHITNAIKEKIYKFEEDDIDIVITEVGGTVGDIEGQAMIEAIRQIGIEQPESSVVFIHVTLLPYISGSNELKSKPTQHSVKEIQALGISPDILVCRADTRIPDSMKQKIALFCNVRKENVIENSTVSNLYEVPLMLEKEGLANAVCRKLNLTNQAPDNDEWEKMIKRIKRIKKENNVKIAIVGKYTKLEDSYLSVAESLHHAGFANNLNVEIEFIDSETINNGNVKEKLGHLDGIIVPGGFGERGIEGMISTIKYARENKIPFLGICLGMQMAVVEFARNVLKLNDVNSEEFDANCENPVIHIMDSQKIIKKKGGTMRLGAYPCILKSGSYASKLYGEKEIMERHRHRFEYNNKYRELMEQNGLTIAGTSPDGELVEIVEISESQHPFFIAGQFHPEFKSRPDRPQPLFKELVRKAKIVNSNK
ncbi:MAG: CTP synthase [Clostridia bacterium]|nr:CTP synthase [Clostridia bacterium]